MMFNPKPAGAAVAVVMSLSLVAGAAARPTAESVKPRKQRVHRAAIYWGAYMEGPSTYGGQYRNAPWDDYTWHAIERTAG
jgi:hypothetical protein